MSKDKHPLVGGVITAVRPMSKQEAERCGFEYPFGRDGSPSVLVVRPKGIPADDTFMPVVVPSRDPEGNGPGCLWLMFPPDSTHEEGRVVEV